MSDREDISEARADRSELRADKSATRADVSETRADVSEVRADDSETRADKSYARANRSEKRADLAEARAKAFVYKVAAALTILALGMSLSVYVAQRSASSHADLNTCAIKLLLVNDTNVTDSNRMLYNDFLHKFSPTTKECHAIIQDATA